MVVWAYMYHTIISSEEWVCVTRQSCLSVYKILRWFVTAVQSELWRGQSEETPPVFAAWQTGRAVRLPRGGERGEGLQHQPLPRLHCLERVVGLHCELWGRWEDITAGVCAGPGSLPGGQQEGGGVRDRPVRAVDQLGGVDPLHQVLRLRDQEEAQAVHPGAHQVSRVTATTNQSIWDNLLLFLIVNGYQPSAISAKSALYQWLSVLEDVLLSDMKCISIEYLITPHTNKISKQELIISYLISQWMQEIFLLSSYQQPSITHLFLPSSYSTL